MYVESINKVKDKLESLKKAGTITAWELPYENILTRLDAAYFFVSASKDKLSDISAAFKDYNDFNLCDNEKKTLSEMAYQITFQAADAIENS
ncbi:MAG: hypothetical protein AAGA27_01345 [Pseudomonadota bacterium]